MLIKALLVALVYYVADWLYLGAGVFHFGRPIVIAPLVGLVLGDIKTGIILGGTFEAVFLGVIAVGGSQPADATSGAVIGTAIAILTHVSSSAALAIAVPASLLCLAVSNIPITIINPLLIPKMDKCAEEGDQEGLTRLHFICSFLMPLLGTIVIFLAIWLGSASIGSILKAIPKFVTSGFTAMSKILPAVGIAILLNILFDKKLFGFFFLGFVLVIYLKLPTLAIAIIAVVVAIAQYFNMEQKSTKGSAEVKAASTNSEEGDFFNE